MNEEWKALILDHYKHPRFYGPKEDFAFASEQHNRTCGDHVKVFASLEGKFSQWSFVGAGCSLCLASASLMMELLQNQTKDAVEAIRDENRSMWDGGIDFETASRPLWQALDGLRQYPVRSRCVKLAWQALDEILVSWNSLDISIA
ncbi:MAG: iron-sulfur cluster assembly scaffold protein [Chitinophagaceae bacterium]|nr:iron-sulfur cluster assembly scaffold protein [Oligoflexus sp.]